MLPAWRTAGRHDPPTLILGDRPACANRSSPLDQYGMEYNPVAINEVLAYSFCYAGCARSTPTGSSSSWSTR